jgi:hypothetical protein
MATQYPNALDILINPQPTDTLNSGAVPHHEQHANLNDAVEAIQTVLGINPAGVHITVKDRIISAETLLSNLSLLNSLTDVTITSVATNDVIKFNGTNWINSPEKEITDGGNF